MYSKKALAGNSFRNNCPPDYAPKFSGREHSPMVPGPQANSHTKEMNIDYLSGNRKDSQNNKEWKKDLLSKCHQNQSRESLLHHSGGNSKEEIGPVNNGNYFPGKAAIRNINPFEKETKNHTPNMYKFPSGTKHGRDCVAGKKSPLLPTDVYKDRQPGTYNILAEKLPHEFLENTDQPRGHDRSYQVDRNLHSFEGNLAHRQTNSIDSRTKKPNLTQNKD